MRRMSFDEAEMLKIALQQEISRSPESRYDHRLHGLLLFCKGLSSYEIADLLGHSPRTIQYWFHRFEKEGLTGLWDMEGQGRLPALDEQAKRRLEEDLRRPPTTLGYSQGQWDGVLLCHHLDQAFGTKLGVRQCQRLWSRPARIRPAKYRQMLRLGFDHNGIQRKT
ncbi:MAG: helix-turn-helix domain-containing protein [Pseudomonadota bacterium]